MSPERKTHKLCEAILLSFAAVAATPCGWQSSQSSEAQPKKNENENRARRRGKIIFSFKLISIFHVCIQARESLAFREWGWK